MMIKLGALNFVSIHLYLQEALEYSAEEGINLTIQEFQSIYTYKRRWNLTSYQMP